MMKALTAFGALTMGAMSVASSEWPGWPGLEAIFIDLPTSRRKKMESVRDENRSIKRENRSLMNADGISPDGVTAPS